MATKTDLLAETSRASLDHWYADRAEAARAQAAHDAAEAACSKCGAKPAKGRPTWGGRRKLCAGCFPAAVTA